METIVVIVSSFVNNCPNRWGIILGSGQLSTWQRYRLLSRNTWFPLLTPRHKAWSNYDENSFRLISLLHYELTFQQNHSVRWSSALHGALLLCSTVYGAQKCFSTRGADLISRVNNWTIIVARSSCANMISDVDAPQSFLFLFHTAISYYTINVLWFMREFLEKWSRRTVERIIYIAEFTPQISCLIADDLFLDRVGFSYKKPKYFANVYHQPKTWTSFNRPLTSHTLTSREIEFFFVHTSSDKSA